MYDINGDGKHDYKDSAIHHELSNSLEKGPTHQGGKVSYSEWVKRKIKSIVKAVKWTLAVSLL